MFSCHPTFLQAGAANRRRISARSSRLSWAVVAGPSLLLTGRDRRTMQSTFCKAEHLKISRVTRLIVLRVTGARRKALGSNHT